MVTDEELYSPLAVALMLNNCVPAKFHFITYVTSLNDVDGSIFKQNELSRFVEKELPSHSYRALHNYCIFIDLSLAALIELVLRYVLLSAAGCASLALVAYRVMRGLFKRERIKLVGFCPERLCD